VSPQHQGGRGGGGGCGLPLPHPRLGSPGAGEVLVCGFLCQMVFDTNIDVNGVWLVTLFVAGVLLLFRTARSWREPFHLVTFVCVCCKCLTDNYQEMVF
jgi:hypothetical protein